MATYKKLTQEEKEKIRKEYSLGSSSVRQLAEKYGASRMTINVIVNDEAAARAKERNRKYVHDNLRTCPECGKTVFKRYNYCPYCATPLKENL